MDLKTVDNRIKLLMGLEKDEKDGIKKNYYNQEIIKLIDIKQNLLDNKQYSKKKSLKIPTKKTV